MAITIQLFDSEGCEEQISLPSKKEVCPECGGEGYTLREGMRGIAYTPEEFNEAFFEEEDRQEYFTRGGKYDQVCSYCKGKNVVDVPDPEQMTEEQKVQFEQWEKDQAELARSRAEDRHTMRMESGCWD